MRFRSNLSSFLSQAASSFVVLGVFALDRLTKWIVLRSMYLGESIPVLPFFQLTHIHNTGVAFGLGQDMNAVFTVTSAALLVVLLVLRRSWEKRYQDWRLTYGLSLIIAGALGNLYDRIVYGSVVDFLDFFIGQRHWPAFNVADSAICIGAALLVVSQWKPKPLPAPPSAS